MEQTTKPFWQSKTILLNVVGALLAAVSIFYPAANSVTVWMTANAALIGSVWAGLNVILRFVTKDKITLGD